MVAVSLKKKKKKKKKKKNIIFFFFKQKTAYEMCDSDWSSDVCSSDLNSFKKWKRIIKGLRPSLQQKMSVLQKPDSHGIAFLNPSCQTGHLTLCWNVSHCIAFSSFLHGSFLHFCPVYKHPFLLRSHAHQKPVCTLPSFAGLQMRAQASCVDWSCR